ncbi:MAG: alginate lyase family protein [Tannerellaceae bacterium]|jgi:hypothetical protein|nr:alginate lyase family protein [Tannerellaceae bacterium]
MKAQTTIIISLIVFCGLVCKAQTIENQAPAPFIIKKEALLANKQRMAAGDADILHMMDHLLHDADAALNSGPYSVVFKDKTPPSGDKRDFMSVGPYWWPDPAKADGLPYVRRDGETNPERHAIKDAEFFKALVEDVQTLALAHFYTGERKYSDKAMDLLKAWFIKDSTKMHPNLKYGQAIPGITEGRGIGLIDTRGIAYLVDAIQILRLSEGLPVDVYIDLRIWCAEFLSWMQTSSIGLDEADEHNNHGTYYDVQTVALSLFIGKNAEAARILTTVTTDRISKQIKPDGSQPHELARTLSWNYSLMNLTGFFELAAMGDVAGVDLWRFAGAEGQSIRNAFFWMMPYAAREAEWTFQQIKPFDPSGFVNLAKIAATKFQDDRIRRFLYDEDNHDYKFILTH